jgi:hypothetical protein
LAGLASIYRVTAGVLGWPDYPLLIRSHAGVAIREVAEAQPGEAAAEVIGVIFVGNVPSPLTHNLSHADSEKKPESVSAVTVR